MDDENAGLKDLLGDPWVEARDPRGRKRHKRLPQIAEKVALLKGSGLTAEQISARIGLSEPTLRKYYFRELEQGAALAAAVLNEAMWEKAKAGNVGAARFIREEFGKGAARSAEQRVSERQPTTPSLGVKAERQAAAGRIGGKFATPEGPKLVVRNS